MMSFFARSALVVSCIVGATSAANAEIINFDDIDLEGESFKYPIESYADLYFINFGCVDSELATEEYGYSGYTVSSVSGVQSAFSGGGISASIYNGSDPFDLHGGYFTAAWRDNLQLRVRAFVGADNQEIYNEVFSLNTMEPMYLELGIQSAWHITFETWGGTDAGWNGIGSQFVMDDLNMTIPAPAGMLLLGLGAIGGRSRRRG